MKGEGGSDGADDKGEGGSDGADDKGEVERLGIILKDLTADAC